MSRFNIGDRVLVHKDAPVIDDINNIFTTVMSRVLDVNEDKDQLVLGIHDRVLVVSEEFCDRYTKDDMENRVKLFNDTLHRFLEFFGAKLFGGKNYITVTLDEGESFYKISPNHVRIDKGAGKR